MSGFEFHARSTGEVGLTITSQDMKELERLDKKKKFSIFSKIWSRVKGRKPASENARGKLENELNQEILHRALSWNANKMENLSPKAKKGLTTIAKAVRRTQNPGFQIYLSAEVFLMSCGEIKSYSSDKNKPKPTRPRSSEKKTEPVQEPEQPRLSNSLRFSGTDRTREITELEKWNDAGLKNFINHLNGFQSEEERNQYLLDNPRLLFRMALKFSEAKGDLEKEKFLTEPLKKFIEMQYQLFEQEIFHLYDSDNKEDNPFYRRLAEYIDEKKSSIALPLIYTRAFFPSLKSMPADILLEAKIGEDWKEQMSKAGWIGQNQK